MVMYIGVVQLEISREVKLGDASRGCTVRSLRGGEAW
jgi:hypothetical protein